MEDRIYRDFVARWVERSERVGEPVDKPDKFINLWIAFNGWLKSEYGEQETDANLIRLLIDNKEFESVFNEMQKDEMFSEALNYLSDLTVADMRRSEDNDRIRHYDGSFKSLCEVLYQIRCNLFHGRKNPKDDEKDRVLVSLAFDILHPMLTRYLKQYWD